MALRVADDVPESAAARFVKLCLSSRWDAGALEAARAVAAQDGFDWRLMRQVAGRGNVAPLLYQITQGSGLVPAPLAAELREAYQLTTARNVRLFHRLELVLHRLDAEGVPAIVLKGAALIQEVYHNLGLRPMADLDLLVRQEDVPLTRRVLSALGYEAFYPDKGATDTYCDAVMLADPAAHEAALDIHWSLFGSPYYYHRIPMDWFWQTALPTRFGDASAQVLAPAAQVLYLCAHILQHARGEEVKLIAFHDVAAALTSYGGQLDWDELLSKTQAYDLVLAVQHVLYRLRQEWHVPLPDTVLVRLDALQPAPDEQRIFDQLTAPSLAQGFWSNLLRIPGWRPRLAFARSILFPTADYMRWRYSIKHDWLLPLYYPYRWFSSLRRIPPRTPLPTSGQKSRANPAGCAAAEQSGSAAEVNRD